LPTIFNVSVVSSTCNCHPYDH